MFIYLILLLIAIGIFVNIIRDPTFKRKDVVQYSAITLVVYLLTVGVIHCIMNQ